MGDAVWTVTCMKIYTLSLPELKMCSINFEVMAITQIQKALTSKNIFCKETKIYFLVLRTRPTLILLRLEKK